jgi:hypothetical protein
VNIKDIQYFDLLKTRIVASMQQTYTGINSSISEWKGQDILDFQEELLGKVNAHISEKWFYTHMKTTNHSLPRIDMLNLLSKYAGYLNWEDFKYKNRQPELLPGKKRNPDRLFLIVPFITITLLCLLLIFYKIVSNIEFSICFYDADTKQKILNSIIEVNMIEANQSTSNILCGPDGCFSLKTHRRSIRFVVNTPYYYPDTITLNLGKSKRQESVKLQPNNYALMLYYFSRMNVSDWKKRRNQLDEMIADNARIYQIFDAGLTGMELYDKWEFINKLTMPASGLRNLEILDTRYQGEKIIVIRFKQMQPD